MVHHEILGLASIYYGKIQYSTASVNLLRQLYSMHLSGKLYSTCSIFRILHSLSLSGLVAY